MAEVKSSFDASLRWGSRGVNEVYEIDSCIGEGTYGFVPFRLLPYMAGPIIAALCRLTLPTSTFSAKCFVLGCAITRAR